MRHRLLVRRETEDFEWEVASSDLSDGDFRQSDDEVSHFRDLASRKIRTRIKRFLHGWRMRRSNRLDMDCEVATKLRLLAKVLLDDPAIATDWFILLVKHNWIRTIDDAKQVPEHVWNEWSTFGLIPFKIAIALRSYQALAIADATLPCLPSPVRRRSTISLSTSETKNSSSSIATTAGASETSTFMSSLLTLQSKLVEYARGRVKTRTPRLPEEDIESLASQFSARMEVCVEGRWLPQCSVKLVQSSRMRWSLTWWSLGREEEPPLGHVAILSIAKVVRIEERTFAVKYRSFNKIEEIRLKCETEEEQVRAGKLMRNLIRENRRKIKTVT